MNGTAQALKLIDKRITPWKKKHAEDMAKLLEQEKQADIKKKEAEISELNARAVKNEAEKKDTC